MTYLTGSAPNLYTLHINYSDAHKIERKLGIYSKTSPLDARCAVYEIARADFIELCNDTSINYSINWEATLKSLNDFSDYEIIKMFLVKRDYSTIDFLYKNGHLSIDLLRNVKDEMHWYTITIHNYFKLDYDFLDEFKEYLIFTTLGVSNGKYTRGGTHNAVYNLKGKRYSSYRNQCLSLSSTVLWTEDLLESLADYWDWNDLSRNTHLPFTGELISKFASRWNWEILSSNKAVYWGKELVNSFITKVNIGSLCLNSNVDWFNVLPALVEYDGMHNKILWNILSNNPGLDARLIGENYPWVFKTEYPADYPFFQYTQNSTYKRLDVYPLKSSYYKPQDSYKEVALPFTLSLKPSISSNTGITWTDELLAAHEDKLDFWMIALRGKISGELVIKYAARFDVNRFTHFTYQKHSDWGTFGVYHFNSCWDNFLSNPNFTINTDLLEWGKDYKVKVVDSYDPFDSPSNDESSAEELIAESNSWGLVSNILKRKATYRFDYSLL